MIFVDFTFVIEQSNCENCTLWPWPTFSGHNLKFVYLWNGKSYHTNLWETFIDFDISHRMVPLLISLLYSVTLTLLFDGQNLKMLMSLKLWELANKCTERLKYLDICQRYHYESYTMTCFFKVNFFLNFNISKTFRASVTCEMILSISRF